METVLTVENVSAAYRKNEVLSDVSFQVEKGTLTSIVGPNGAGKSTLLKVILELHHAISGEVNFLVKPIKQPNRELGMYPSVVR